MDQAKAQALRTFVFVDGGPAAGFRILFGRKAAEAKAEGLLRGCIKIVEQKSDSATVEVKTPTPVKTIGEAVDAVTWLYRATSTHFQNRLRGAVRSYLKLVPTATVKLVTATEESFGIYQPFGTHIKPWDPTEFGYRAAEARKGLQMAIQQYVSGRDTAKDAVFHKDLRTKEVKEWVAHRGVTNDPWWTALVEQAIAGDVGRMPAHPARVQPVIVKEGDKVAPNVLAVLKKTAQ